MIALIQRVSHANVVVENETVGEIGQGLLVLLAVEPEDTEQKRLDWPNELPAIEFLKMNMGK